MPEARELTELEIFFLDEIKRALKSEFYNFKKIVGASKKSIILLVQDPHGKEYAVKTSFEGGNTDLSGEAEVLNVLQPSKFPVRFHAFFEKNGRNYMVMEYLDPSKYQTLDKLVEQKRLSREDIIRITSDLGVGFDELFYKYDFYNGDESAEDLFIFCFDDQNKPVVKMVDFGVVGFGEKGQPSLTHIGITPPEQLLPDFSGKPQPKVFQLAVYLFFMLTNHYDVRVPYEPSINLAKRVEERKYELEQEGKSADTVNTGIAVVYQLYGNSKQKLEKLAQDLFIDDNDRTNFIGVMMKALSTNPVDRHEDCAEFLRHIAPYLENMNEEFFKAEKPYIQSSSLDPSRADKN